MTARIAHFDITAPDDAALIDFYAGLFDWSVDRKGPGYTLLQPADGPGGAIVEAPEARVVLGVTVDDLEAAVRRVTELGGTVQMPPTDNGWVTKALVTDPSGNPLSLIQAQRPAGR